MDNQLFNTISKFCDIFPKITEIDDIVYLLSLSRFQELFQTGFLENYIELYAVFLSVNYNKELVYNCFIATMKLSSIIDLSSQINIILNNILNDESKMNSMNDTRNTISSIWKNFQNGQLLSEMTLYINKFLEKTEISISSDATDSLSNISEENIPFYDEQTNDNINKIDTDENTKISNNVLETPQPDNELSPDHKEEKKGR